MMLMILNYHLVFFNFKFPFVHVRRRSTRGQFYGL
jgi:hypothetical protein